MRIQVTYSDLVKFLSTYFQKAEDRRTNLALEFMATFKVKAPPKNIEVFGICPERNLEQTKDDAVALKVIIDYFVR